MNTRLGLGLEFTLQHIVGDSDKCNQSDKLNGFYRQRK